MGSNLCTSRHSEDKHTEEGELMIVRKSTAPSVFEFFKPECLKVGSGDKHKRSTKLLRSEERMLEDEEEEGFASHMTLSECLSREERSLSPSPHEGVCSESTDMTSGWQTMGKLSPRVYPEKSGLSYSLLEKTESHEGLSSDGGVAGEEGERGRLSTPRSRSNIGEKKKKVSFRSPEADVVVFDRCDDCNEREG